MTVAERLKDNVKDFVFQAAIKASDLPPARREKIANAFSFLGILSPNERRAARIIHDYTNGGHTTLKDVVRISRGATRDYAAQILEIAAVLKMADRPSEILWPAFTEPTLTEDQERFFQTGGILYTVHAGNSLAAANSVIGTIRELNQENHPRIVVLMERQPRTIQEGYGKICEYLGITPFFAEETGVKALENLEFDFLLWHGDRRGSANAEVSVCGETALISKWVAFLSQNSKKPILSGMAVRLNTDGLNRYQLILGNTIDPKDYKSLKRKEAIQQQTVAIAKETEKLLIIDPYAYLFSPFWKARR